MLAREYVDKPECQDKKQGKPVILSHAMMPGLLEGQEKMSKSDPDSAIFMEDGVEDVNRKIKKAYCPPQIVDGNPCLAYLKMLVFPLNGTFHVPRKESNGGDMYVNFLSLYKDMMIIISECILVPELGAMIYNEIISEPFVLLVLYPTY